LQRRFPINETLLRSGDIRDQVAKLCEIAQKFDVFGPPDLYGNGPPKFVTEFYKSGSPLSMYVAKFGDDRPSDLGD